MHFSIFMFALTLILSAVEGYSGRFFIEFNLQGVELPYSDVIYDARPDAYCIAKVKLDNGPFKSIGQTEYIKSSSNPIWNKNFNIDYRIGEYKSLKVEVWDKDWPDKDDFLGSFTVDVNELASNNNYEVTRDYHREDYFVFEKKESSIILRHRIYKVEGARSSAFGGHIPSFLPYNILVALSLYYFL